MEIIIALICISLVIAGSFLTAFLISVKSGQYDDLETPSMRILFEKTDIIEKENDGNTGNKK